MLLAAVLALHLSPVTPDVPNKQPQLAAGNGVVALAFASGNGIWLARSTDNGRTFAPPAKIAVLPRMLAGRHRGPRVVMAGNSILVSAIAADSAAPGHAGKHAAPADGAGTSFDGNLVSWRSTDGGKTWSKPVVLNDHPTSAREGLHAMSADAAGNMAAVWLDLRTPGTTRLFGAFSKDAGATWSKNVMVYQSPGKTICECCHPSLAALGNGEFAVMWRNAVDGSRDLYALRIKDGKPAGSAVKQGEGTWKLEACPMDGGGIVQLNGQLVSAWRREKDIYLARTGKPEVKLGTGTDVALAANAKGEYAVWTNGKAIEALAPGSSTPARLSESGAFASLVALPDGAVLAAWEENGGIATKRLE
jgi:BNR/Asp-box repeat